MTSGTAPSSAAPRAAELPPPPVPASSGWRVLVYPHTHWDREWYRSYERFRMQLVGVVDRALDALDSDPRFTTFVLDGQTVVLDDYLAMRPEELPRLRRLVQAGRLEVGPWFVLPDEFLVSGEALVRNLAQGRRVASRFGTPLAVGYLPDPFGHVAQMPALLRGFGIDNVIFSRGMGDAFARTGSEFRWVAQDGHTDVLALVQTSPYTNGYCNGELLGPSVRDGDDGAHGLVAGVELAEHLARFARTDVLVVAAGCDHATIDPALPQVVERLAELLPGAVTEVCGLDRVVAAQREAEARLDAAGTPLERLGGELRGSLHAPILASIFSARIPLKQGNDHVQGLLERHVEPLLAVAVAAGIRPSGDVEPFQREAWRLLLQNHAHDSIGGCSIDRVHDQMPARTSRAEAICLGLLEDLQIAMGLGGQAVVHGVGSGAVVERADGAVVAVDATPTGRLVPLAPVAVAGGAGVVDERTVRAGTLEAQVVELEGGAALRIADGDDAVLVELVDEPDAGDEYDFGALEGDRPTVARLERWSASMAGPAVAELQLVHVLELPEGLDGERRRRSAATIRHEVFTRVRVSPVSPLAQLDVRLDNRARDHRLRLRATPVDGSGAEATPVDSRTVHALGHFAVVERPARPAVPAVAWRQDPPGLDHCSGAVRLAPDGVLLAGRGLHEYEAREVAPAAWGTTGRGTLALELTLLRAVGWLSRDDVAGRPGHAGPGLETPGAQCLGAHHASVAVAPGARASFRDAAAFLVPPLVLEPLGVEAVQESGARDRIHDVLADTPVDPAARLDALGLELDDDGATHSALKLADDGSGDLVVRWWLPAHAARPARPGVRITAALRGALRARLDELPLGPVEPQDGRVGITVQPGAIATIRLQLQR